MRMELGSAVAPWAYKARRAMGRRPLKLEEAAVRSWEVAPGHEEAAIPIFIPEAHFARIRRGADGESVEGISRLIRPGKHVAAPTMAYLLKDALLVDAKVYAGMLKEDLFFTGGLEGRICGEVESGVLARTYAGSKWFGHFMHDELPLGLLVERMGEPVMHRRREYGHEAGWREALGVAAPPAFDVLRARELVMVRDFAQNESKRERCRELRRRLGHLPKGAERVYLKRENRGADPRVLVNEEAVMERLRREGFVVVEPAKMSVGEILRACLGAKMMVSVEGSHTSLMLYCGASGGRSLFLNPPWRVSVVEACITWSYERRAGIFVCEEAGTEREFRADPEEVVRVVEEFERTTQDKEGIAFH